MRFVATCRASHQSDYDWPHAFATTDEILSRYDSNHIHAIPGDHVEEIRALCEILVVDYDGFGSVKNSSRDG